MAPTMIVEVRFAGDLYGAFPVKGLSPGGWGSGGVKSFRNIWQTCGSANNFALTRRLKGAGPRALCILGISPKFCSDPKIAHGQSPMGKFGNAVEPYREMTVEELFPLAAAPPRAGRPAGTAPGLQMGEGAGGRFSHTSRYQRGAGCYARARLRADPRA